MNEKAKTAAVPYRKSLSGKQLMSRQYDSFDLPADLYKCIGDFTSGANVLIWGGSGSGKTSFAMRLLKALIPHGKAYYNTVEQAGRKSFQKAVKRENLEVHPASVISWGIGDSWDEMCAKIRRNQAKFIFLDSIQYMRFDQFAFLELTKKYPKRCFIVIAHAAGKEPKGEAAQSIRYDVDVKIRVEEGVAYPDSRLSDDNVPYRIFHKNRGDVAKGKKLNPLQQKLLLEYKEEHPNH